MAFIKYVSIGHSIRSWLGIDDGNQPMRDVVGAMGTKQSTVCLLAAALDELTQLRSEAKASRKLADATVEELRGLRADMAAEARNPATPTVSMDGVINEVRCLRSELEREFERPKKTVVNVEMPTALNTIVEELRNLRIDMEKQAVEMKAMAASAIAQDQEVSKDILESVYRVRALMPDAPTATLAEGAEAFAAGESTADDEASQCNPRANILVRDLDRSGLSGRAGMVLQGLELWHLGSLTSDSFRIPGYSGDCTVQELRAWRDRMLEAVDGDEQSE